ncbi:MAG TPA: PRC-barrel domain-containing protein [Chloroflexota bacterium]|nr:PRC-barrel domain-containing protein [Chloroflexota bacterium]
MDKSALIGKQVMASDGVAGVVEDVLFDAEGTPRYLVVRDRGVFGSDLILPYGWGALDTAMVRVAASRAELAAGDRYDPAKYGESAGLFSASAERYDATETGTDAPHSQP